MSNVLPDETSPVAPVERLVTHKASAVVMAATIALGLCLAAAAAFLIGVEYDEAWIVAAHLGLFQPDTLPDLPPVLTTGGPHMLIIGLFGEPGPGAVSLARGLSFVSLLLLLVLLERVLRRWFADLTARLIVLAMVIASPGTLLLGGMGYGVVPATLLLLCGFFFWTGFTGSSWIRIAGAGLLFGMALATRWTLLPLAVPMLLSGAVLHPEFRYRWLQGVAVTAVAVAIFAGFLLWHSGLVGPQETVSSQNTLETSAAASGLSATLPRPARLTGIASRFVTLVSVPVILSVLIGVLLLRDQISRSLRCVILALALASLIIALAWALRSPFLHTRYIWPAVVMLNIAAGLTLAQLFSASRWKTEPFVRWAGIVCLAIPIGMAAEAYTVSLRLVAAGSGYETNHAGYEAQEAHFKAFRLKKEQRAITAFLSQQLPPDVRVAAIGLPAEWGVLQLALLSQRPIEEYAVKQTPPEIPDILITHAFARLSPAGREWLRSISSNTQAVYGYRIHWIDPARFAPPDQDVLIDDGLYRFSLRRAQSLSGD